MAEGIRVEIERNGCISCAACWTACPEFFEENEDDGLSQVKEEYRIEGDRARGEAPESLKESIQEAVDSCPTEVIKIQAGAMCAGDAGIGKERKEKVNRPACRQILRSGGYDTGRPQVYRTLH